MTKEEIYAKYLNWHKGADALPITDLFINPAANIDVFEDDKTIVNHLYYLIVEKYENATRNFLFYEVNTFEKTECGSLKLIQTTYHLAS